MQRMAEKCISTIKESSVVCDLLYSNTNESLGSDETAPRCDQKCDSSCSGTPSTATPTIMHIPLDIAPITNLIDTTTPDISYTQNTPSTMMHFMSDECETKNGQAFTNCEKVDVYLETPVVDDNNESFGASTTTTTTTNATSKHSINIVPKRLSDEFYSADDCYSDNEDVRDAVTLIDYNDSAVQVDDKSITPNSNVESSADMSRFEENSIDNIIDSAYNEDEISSCSNLIDITNEHDDSSPHSTVSPGIQDNGEEANHGDEHLMDHVIYYDNDVQSVDAANRKNFEIKEKFADIRNGSLVSGDNRLNLGLLNTFSQKIDQDSSPVDDLSQNIDQNSISTTPTSSRTKTMRFGNAKTTAKLNLSESLEKLDVVADKQTLSESDYINKSRNSSVGNNNSTVTERSADDQSPIRIKLLQQMDSFSNSNSNDSLLSFQFSEKKCGNNSESSQSTTATQTSSSITHNCDEHLTSSHLAIASTSKAARSSDSSDCTASNSHEIDAPAKGCSAEDCMLIEDEHAIKQEMIEEEVVIADSDSKQPFDMNLPSSSSSQRMSLVNNNQQMDENNYDQSHALMGLENDHDYEEDTWADCEEMSDVEEVCTCRDYSDEDAHGSEDELPSRDVDLSYYAHLDPLSEDILPENANGDSTPKNQRKRKMTDTLSHDGSSCGDATPGNRKRLALDSVTSPKVLLTPSTPTLTAASPTTHGLVLSDKRTPRLLIPTRDHPPPELSDWLLQFQRWTNAERLLAVDQLIEHCEPTQVRHMMKVIEPHFQRDFISLLPKELALHVLSYLEPKVLLRAAQTCRSWRYVVLMNTTANWITKILTLFQILVRR